VVVYTKIHALGRLRQEDFELRPAGLHSKTLSQKKKSQELVLRPVILATQEAEIRRIEVRSQPALTVRETLS
jgi:hypothetical protein